MLKRWRDEKNKCNCFNVMKRKIHAIVLMKRIIFFVLDKSKVNYGWI